MHGSNRMSIRRRSVVVLLTVTAALAISAFAAASASAQTVVRVDHNASGSLTIPAGDLCSFPIQSSATQTWTSTYFYDDNGQLTKIIPEGFEQDTFSANGKTLVGNPYHFTFVVQFVDGVAVGSHSVGVAEKVPLPDGSVYIVAGRLDVLNANGPFLTVDSGNSGNNLDAFCAALS